MKGATEDAEIPNEEVVNPTRNREEDRRRQLPTVRCGRNFDYEAGAAVSTTKMRGVFSDPQGTRELKFSEAAT